MGSRVDANGECDIPTCYRRLVRAEEREERLLDEQMAERDAQRVKARSDDVRIMLREIGPSPLENERESVGLHVGADG